MTTGLNRSTQERICIVGKVGHVLGGHFRHGLTVGGASVERSFHHRANGFTRGFPLIHQGLMPFEVVGFTAVVDDILFGCRSRILDHQQARLDHLIETRRGGPVKHELGTGIYGLDLETNAVGVDGTDAD
ncbi:MAG: hypothetical protein B7Z55_19870 [Planctomycetales bacterium 12-60-4]|nr:MAG: hypothetical protein B7Z55_19870 [Planctomycetales bacterium 12-60-4]